MESDLELELDLESEPDLELELDLESEPDLELEPDLESELDLELEPDLESEPDLEMDPISPNITLTLIPTLNFLVPPPQGCQVRRMRKCGGCRMHTSVFDS